MTLFTTLLVLIFERLFKLGEHWQLESPLIIKLHTERHRRKIHNGILSFPVGHAHLLKLSEYLFHALLGPHQQ